MENPACWTKATNVIEKAITDCNKYMEEGVFGHSLAMFIELRLRNEGLLTKESEEITGLQE
jgi:hypothetical protein